MIGIALYVGIFLFILAFCKIGARADKNMRMICNGDFIYSDLEGHNSLNLKTEDKKSKLMPVPQS